MTRIDGEYVAPLPVYGAGARSRRMPGAFAFTIVFAAAPIAAPTVENFVPPAHPYDKASFDIKDDSGLFRTITCLARYEGRPLALVHIDAGGLLEFVKPHSGTRTVIDGGFHYDVWNRNGWRLDTLTGFFALPVDRTGALG